MLSKIILLFFLVGYVLCEENFLRFTKRSELFRYLDNQVSDFNITLSDDDFLNLKEVAKAGISSTPVPKEKLPNDIQKLIDDGYYTLPSTYYEKKEVHQYVSAKMATIIIKSKKLVFEDVILSFDNNNSSSKPNFKLSLPEEKSSLFNRYSFQLLSDANDPSFLRTKLACDIRNRLGTPSQSANYVNLYINGEFFGLYLLLDSIDSQWAHSLYGEDVPPVLYKCDDKYSYLTDKSSYYNCISENDNDEDHQLWKEFLKHLDSAQSLNEVDQYMDIDEFFIDIGFEFLVGSWDNYLNNGHHYYMNYPGKKRWQMILYDFEKDFGLEIPEKNYTDIHLAEYSFKKWTEQRDLLDKIIFNGSGRFDNTIRSIINHTFNPDLLFPRIDELKEFIRPYVKRDKTPNADGMLPGRFNNNTKEYSMAEWNANTEFTKVETTNGEAYGLKYWILRKYRYICQKYDIKTCNPEYLEENYVIPVHRTDKYVDPVTITNTVTASTTKAATAMTTKAVTTTTKATTATTVNSNITTKKPTTTTKASTKSLTQSTNTPQCWVEVLGYECCSPKNKVVYYHDENGQWGYNFATDSWCGISPYAEITEDEVCWSEKLGYSCCKGCTVYQVNDDGKWGYEQGKWCGLQSYCDN